MKSYAKSNKLKYETKDSPDQVHQQIREKATAYFKGHRSRRANVALWLKALSLVVLIGLSYYSLLHSGTFLILLLSYIAFGFTFLLLGINIGHDAAHNCVTGNHRVDNVLFQIIFGLQGLSGYVWKLRHNFSHHIFPNIYDNDSDLELSKLVLLSPHEKKMSIHKYQHIYVPFMYIWFSLIWIFYVDFAMLFKKKHANIKLNRVPPLEYIKLIVIKATYLYTFLYLPHFFTGLPFTTILVAYLIMNFSISLFLAFTFYISHHVLETKYAEARYENTLVKSSWIRHQIVSTTDFNIDSKLGNYIFGGFNLHVAHHIFPEVSHVHYPALTKIIRETLDENQLNWYKSFGFFEGVASHLSLLKKTGRGEFEIEEELEEKLDEELVVA